MSKPASADSTSVWKPRAGEQDDANGGSEPVLPKCASGSKRRVVMVGAFPPPLHGMSAVNTYVKAELLAAGTDLCVIDIGSRSLDRSLGVRLQRLPRVVAGLLALARVRCSERDSLYVNVSGGAGQAYELVFVALARLKGLRLFLHHHNFTYLDRPSMLARLVMAAAGQRATHIVLSDGMGERLRRVYHLAAHRVPVSNAALLPAPTSPLRSRSAGLTTVGFLANISREKGILLFLDVLEHGARRGWPMRGIVAGPFEDKATESLVRKRVAELPYVTYVGPVYGSVKLEFFDSIDALLFPTMYANEAEPLVIHEALACGLPVIAYARGAIGEILTDGAGIAIDPGTDFVAAAAETLARWLDVPLAYQAASEAALRKAQEVRKTSRQAWERVKKHIVNGP